MQYINVKIKNFIDFVKKNNMKVILFGAGAVCKTFIPYIFEKYNLCDSILWIVDNNTAKQGQSVRIGSREICIRNISSFDGIKEDYCVLITNGDFYSVMRQLDGIASCNDKKCFIAAIMQLERVYDKEHNCVYKDYDTPCIPKVINYCWFSGNPMPESLQKCIESWKKYCPDYEIVRWDESNYDIAKYKYTKEAYEMKKWGYIPDIVRLEILYEYGGFYFDTDVKIIKNLDELRYQKAFCGRERAGHINFGGGSGSIPKNNIIKEILDFRKDEPFNLGNGLFNSEASGYYENTPLVRYGLKYEDINQALDGINIYASEFFSPYNYINGENIQNKNTFSIHYFNGSWIETSEDLRKQTREKYGSIKKGMGEL